MNLYFVTSNLHKLRSAQRILGPITHLERELPEIQHIDPIRVVHHKLQSALPHAPCPLIIEDSTLSLRCLGGLPGPLIKWFLASIGPQGIADLVSKYADHRAVAAVILGYQAKDSPPQFFSGEVSGQIVSPRGEGGFGYDSIFQPEGSQLTFGELFGQAYDDLSPRKIAFTKLKAYLDTTS